MLNRAAAAILLKRKRQPGESMLADERNATASAGIFPAARHVPGYQRRSQSAVHCATWSRQSGRENVWSAWGKVCRLTRCLRICLRQAGDAAMSENARPVRSAPLMMISVCPWKRENPDSIRSGSDGGRAADGAAAL